MESRFTRRMLIGTAGAFSGAALFAACATAAPMAEGEAAEMEEKGEADSKEMMGPAEVKFWTYQDFLLEGHIGNVLLNEFQEANPNVDWRSRRLTSAVAAKRSSLPRRRPAPHRTSSTWTAIWRASSPRRGSS